jgi:hypothetical protein
LLRSIVRCYEYTPKSYYAPFRNFRDLFLVVLETTVDYCDSGNSVLQRVKLKVERLNCFIQPLELPPVNSWFWYI